MSNLKYFISLLVAISFWQCEIQVDDFKTSAGEADFSTYVALGDSYSAGYIDGALGLDGQKVSLPNILANQFLKVGGGEFKQPLFPEEKSAGTTVIDLQGNINGYFKLNLVNGSLKPVPTMGDKTVFANLIGAQGPFNNMAVPGAKSYHLLAEAFGNPIGGNPFFTRFASAPGVSSVMDDAAQIDHSFFTIWIGGNDVLGFALTGGTADPITPLANFEAALNGIVSKMIGSGRNGVIANIADIDALPYFNVVPYNALPLTQAQADALNAGYAGYNIAANAAGRPAIVFVAGANPMVMEDPKMDDMPVQARFRQIKQGEKILLNTPTDKIASEGWGSLVPIPDKYVLDLEDIESIKESVAGYNTIIENIAEDNNLALVDVLTVMNDLKTGTIIDGNNYSNGFVTGNVFSLDGIHPTPRGYAIIANEFIKAINLKFNASVPLVNVNDYKMVLFP